MRYQSVTCQAFMEHFRWQNYYFTLALPHIFPSHLGSFSLPFGRSYDAGKQPLASLPPPIDSRPCQLPSPISMPSDSTLIVGNSRSKLLPCHDCRPWATAALCRREPLFRRSSNLCDRCVTADQTPPTPTFVAAMIVVGASLIFSGRRLSRAIPADPQPNHRRHQYRHDSRRRFYLPVPSQAPIDRRPQSLPSEPVGFRAQFQLATVTVAAPAVISDTFAVAVATDSDPCLLLPRRLSPGSTQASDRSRRAILQLNSGHLRPQSVLPSLPMSLPPSVLPPPTVVAVDRVGL